jgi:hypothetical protein
MQAPISSTSYPPGNGNGGSEKHTVRLDRAIPRGSLVISSTVTLAGFLLVGAM